MSKFTPKSKRGKRVNDILNKFQDTALADHLRLASGLGLSFDASLQFMGSSYATIHAAAARGDTVLYSALSLISPDLRNAYIQTVQYVVEHKMLPLQYGRSSTC